MKNFEFDLAIIGGGIVGTALFNEAVRNGAKVCLLEKECDVGESASKANSGVVHSGYDPMPNTKMAKFNVQGANMYPALCKRLGVHFVPCGTLTVSDEDGREKLNMLKQRGIKNKVKGLRIVEGEELKALEPNLAEGITLGLFAPTGAVVSPYEMCIALAEEGVINGGEVKLNFKVTSIKKTSKGFEIFSGEQKVLAKFLVNCAGPNANQINAMLGDETYPESFVKGEYILLDKSQKGFVHRPIFPLPTEKGKGILANITVHGNILLGPTATPCEKEDTSCTLSGQAEIKSAVLRTVKKPNFRKIIKLFAGVRIKSGEDFILEKSAKVENFYYAVGICSPGLTSAPAIAKFFFEMLKKDGLKTKEITLKKRKPYVCMEELSESEIKKKIKENPLYGKIVCRCEHVSEGEILDAIHSPLCPTSVDAIKRRVRPTMGRCQGSFCTPKLLKIFAKELKIKEEEVTQNGKGSEILVGDIKEGI